MGLIVDKSCEFLQKEASNGYTEFMSSKHHHFFMSFHSCGNPRKGNKCSRHGKRRHDHFLVKGSRWKETTPGRYTRCSTKKTTYKEAEVEISAVITGEGKRVHFNLCLLAGTDVSFPSGSRKERYLLLICNVFNTVATDNKIRTRPNYFKLNSRSQVAGSK